MKSHLTGLLKVVLVLSFLVVPALASAEGSGVEGKLLTRTEFGSRFHGLDQRLVERKYVEYRNGRIPAPTLDASNMR